MVKIVFVACMLANFNRADIFFILFVRYMNSDKKKNQNQKLDNLEGLKKLFKSFNIFCF